MGAIEDHGGVDPDDGPLPQTARQRAGAELGGLVAEWSVLVDALEQSAKWTDRKQAVGIRYCRNELRRVIRELGLPQT